MCDKMSPGTHSEERMQVFYFVTQPKRFSRFFKFLLGAILFSYSLSSSLIIFTSVDLLKLRYIFAERLGEQSSSKYSSDYSLEMRSLYVIYIYIYTHTYKIICESFSFVY